VTQPCIRIRAYFYIRDGTGRDAMGRDGNGRDGIGRDGAEPQQRVAGYS
jgi:hypothetical protein